MTIAAAFTAGDSDNLMVGRNGVFYDRKGRDWDATITKVIENPISIQQAFWAPYKKFVRLIEEQVAKRAAAGAAASDARMAGAATVVTSAEAKPPEPKKIDVGTVAALGVAVGAIGAFFATVLGLLGNVTALPFWKARGKSDAVKIAQTAHAATAAIETAAGMGNWNEAKAQNTTLGQQCAACHGVYRERGEDGGEFVARGRGHGAECMRSARGGVGGVRDGRAPRRASRNHFP